MYTVVQIAPSCDRERLLLLERTNMKTQESTEAPEGDVANVYTRVPHCGLATIPTHEQEPNSDKKQAWPTAPS